MYNTIENNTKYIAQKRKNINIENNYLLGMHADFMGTRTASRHGGGGDASLQSDSV